MAKQERERNTFFSANGVDCIRVSTGEPYVKPLMRFFKEREKRMAV